MKNAGFIGLGIMGKPMALNLLKKDLNIALQTGDEFSVPLPGTALVAGQMEAAVSQGNGELDHSSLVLLIE